MPDIQALLRESYGSHPVEMRIIQRPDWQGMLKRGISRTDFNLASISYQGARELQRTVVRRTGRLAGSAHYVPPDMEARFYPYVALKTGERFDAALTRGTQPHTAVAGVSTPYARKVFETFYPGMLESAKRLMMKQVARIFREGILAKRAERLGRL